MKHKCTVGAVYDRAVTDRAYNVFVSLLFFSFLGTPALYAETPVTFNNQVARIFQQHCQTCHRPGNIAPFSLVDYADARRHAFEIEHAVESGEMPPWKPVNAHGVFKGERSLSEEEIQTISRWVSEGVQEGAPADLPDAVTFPEAWGGGRPDLVLQPSAPYPVQAGSDDIYRCFPLSLNSSSDLYVRGYEVLPGNRAIVHHVLLFLDESGQSVTLDNADPGPGYTCFGGAGFTTGLNGLGGWAPGASPETFPLGSGVRIPAGARIVIQIHYSTAEASRLSPGPLAPDQTRVGLYLSPTPLQQLVFLPIVNPFFTIPAGDSHYQVKALLPIPTDVELLSIAPHMHLLGREATVEARLPNGQRRQLVRIDDWDFHWQANYTYVEPVLLPAGTVVEMTAYYDNSLNNPKNASNPPVAVGWGERTVDEMCLTFLTVKAPGTPRLNTVPFSISDRGTTSLVTQAGSSAVQVGYARVSEGSGGASGLAIFGYRQNGVLVSEAGVPGSRLLTRGRIAGRTTGPIRSGLAIANPNGEPAAVSFFFTDENGNDAGSGTATIPANGQIANFLDEAPFNGASTFAGSFTFTSSKPVSVTALRGEVNERSEFLFTTLPVVDLSSSPSTSSAVFPHFADGGGWTSEIILINPAETAISGSLQFADQTGQPSSVTLNGQVGTAFNYSIPPRSTRHFVTSGSSSLLRAGSVWIVPSETSVAPAGSLVFSYTAAGVRVTEAGVSLPPAGTAFRIYAESSDSIQSGIAIANASSSPTTVRLELVDVNGASVAATTFPLPGNAQIANFLAEVPGFQTRSLTFRGLLRLTSTSPVAVVGLRGRTNERGDFLITTTPPVPEGAASAGSELFFPHFADAGGYTTQFIIFSNSTGRFLSGNVRFFSQSGQPLDLRLK